MFGYILPVKCEMKMGDFELYRAHYCGLCKQLGQSHGLFSRFLLNYDLVLLAILADALQENKGTVQQEGCFVNPVSKRMMKHNTSGLALASDALILLSYHKLQDDRKDEYFLKKSAALGGSFLLRRQYRTAKAHLPEAEAVITKQMNAQAALEADHCKQVDQACDPTAQMCGALFAEVASSYSDKKILYRLGLFVGQIIYLLDAAEDYPEDLKDGNYNVFVESGISHDEAILAVQNRCRMAAGEIALAYNLLNIKQYKNILDNIFFLGLPASIEAAGRQRTQRRAGHGQINSV